MNTSISIYEKTQKAKNSLKNLLKFQKNNLKSLLKKISNEKKRSLTSISSVFEQIKDYGPSKDFFIDEISSGDSSPSIEIRKNGEYLINLQQESINSSEKQRNNLKIKKYPTVDEVINNLIDTSVLDISDDFPFLNQIVFKLDVDNLGIIITNFTNKFNAEDIRKILNTSPYRPDIKYIKMMFYKSRLSVIIKFNNSKDIPPIFNFLSNNKNFKILFGNDLKVLWFKNKKLDDKTKDFSQIILRNLPSNYNINFLKTFLRENIENIDLEYIEDPFYYKGQISTIITVSNLYQAENLVKSLNHIVLQERYLLKAHLHPQTKLLYSKIEYNDNSHFKSILNHNSDGKNKNLLKMITEKIFLRKKKSIDPFSAAFETKETKEKTENNEIKENLLEKINPFAIINLNPPEPLKFNVPPLFTNMNIIKNQQNLIPPPPPPPPPPLGFGAGISMGNNIYNNHTNNIGLFAQPKTNSLPFNNFNQTNYNSNPFYNIPNNFQNQLPQNPPLLFNNMHFPNNNNNNNNNFNINQNTIGNFNIRDQNLFGNQLFANLVPQIQSVFNPIKNEINIDLNKNIPLPNGSPPKMPGRDDNKLNKNIPLPNESPPKIPSKPTSPKKIIIIEEKTEFLDPFDGNEQLKANNILLNEKQKKRRERLLAMKMEDQK